MPTVSRNVAPLRARLAEQAAALAGANRTLSRSRRSPDAPSRCGERGSRRSDEPTFALHSMTPTPRRQPAARRSTGAPPQLTSSADRRLDEPARAVAGDSHHGDHVIGRRRCRRAPLRSRPECGQRVGQGRPWRQSAARSPTGRGSASALGDLNIPRRELPSGEVVLFARDSRGRLCPDRGTEWDNAELGVVPGLREVGYKDAFPALHGYASKEPSWTWRQIAGHGGGWRLDHLFASKELRPVAACITTDGATRGSAIIRRSRSTDRVDPPPRVDRAHPPRGSRSAPDRGRHRRSPPSPA